MPSTKLFSLFTAGLALFAPLASAYTQPKGSEPKGNPIYEPGLNSIVPVGKPFNITWGPTTEGTITLVLLKGPSTNAVPQYAIAQNIPNSGSHEWTPSKHLAPGTTGYGLQLIVDSDGQYQYSTQFGISNPHYKPSPSGADAAAASSHASRPTGYAPGGNSTTAHPSGWKPHNATTAQPTGNRRPNWHKTTQAPAYSSLEPSSLAATPTPTGGAATIASSFVGLVVAGGVAVFAL